MWIYCCFVCVLQAIAVQAQVPRVVGVVTTGGRATSVTNSIVIGLPMHKKAPVAGRHPAIIVTRNTPWCLRVPAAMGDTVLVSLYTMNGVRVLTEAIGLTDGGQTCIDPIQTISAGVYGLLLRGKKGQVWSCMIQLVDDS